jgi:hypothetical protein
MRTFSEHLGNDATTFGDALHTEVYGQPAVPPASPWLGAARPAKPLLDAAADNTGQQDASGDGPASAGESRALFVAAPGDSVPVRWWLVQSLGAWISAGRSGSCRRTDNRWRCCRTGR